MGNEIPYKSLPLKADTYQRIVDIKYVRRAGSLDATVNEILEELDQLRKERTELRATVDRLQKDAIQLTAERDDARSHIWQKPEPRTRARKVKA